MRFDVKIYGAPYSFDLYDGSKDDLNYFQVFDNRRSTEPVKMTIDRLNSHQIVYNYLRYGYITSGGRPGSFFGLSVVFHGEYCSNFTKLYELFEVVYGTIVKNAVLIDTLPNGEAAFKISQFADAKGEVERVRGILTQNIQGRLANDIKPMSFSAPSYEDRELRLSTNTSNDIIARALSKYATVSISPSYSSGQGKEVETVPPKILMKIQGEKSDLLSKATERLGKVTSFQSDLLAHQAAKQNLMLFYPKYQSIIDGLDGLIESMERQLAEIGKWLRKDPANSLLTDAQMEIDASKKSLSKTYNSLLKAEDLFVGGSDGDGSKADSYSGGGSNGGGITPPQPWPWWKIFFHKYKTRILVATAVILAFVIILFSVKRSSKNPKEGNTNQVDSMHVVPDSSTTDATMGSGSDTGTSNTPTEPSITRQGNFTTASTSTSSSSNKPPQQEAPPESVSKPHIEVYDNNGNAVQGRSPLPLDMGRNYTCKIRNCESGDWYVENRKQSSQADGSLTFHKNERGTYDIAYKVGDETRESIKVIVQ